MLAVILGFSPLIVSALTGALKMLPPFGWLSDAARTPAIRLLAAVISLVYVLIGAYVTGNLNGDLFVLSVQTVALAFMAWLGSLGVFHAFFQKAPVAPVA